MTDKLISLAAYQAFENTQPQDTRPAPEQPRRTGAEQFRIGHILRNRDASEMSVQWMIILVELKGSVQKKHGTICLIKLFDLPDLPIHYGDTASLKKTLKT